MKTDNKTPYNPNVTEEDLNTLGEKAENIHSAKQGDDKQLENREKPVDFTGKNLDVPGRISSNENTKRLNDEENRLHSQGSGHNDHLEDNPNHSPKV